MISMTTLTLIFALPLLAAIALAFVPRNFAVIMRAVAVGVTFVTMLLGILIGVAENMSEGYIGRGMKEIAGFLLILIVLMVRPYGLFGKPDIERV